MCYVSAFTLTILYILYGHLTSHHIFSMGPRDNLLYFGFVKLLRTTLRNDWVDRHVWWISDSILTLPFNRPTWNPTQQCEQVWSQSHVTIDVQIQNNHYHCSLPMCSFVNSEAFTLLYLNSWACGRCLVQVLRTVFPFLMQSFQHAPCGYLTLTPWSLSMTLSNVAFTKMKIRSKSGSPMLVLTH